MSTDHRSQDVLGTCPDCGREITGFDVLIEYETSDGRARSWAECPGCASVVHPE